MAFRSVGLLVPLALLVFAAGCGASHENGLQAALPAAPREFSFDEVLSMKQQLDTRESHYLQDCLSRHGFDQLTKASALGRPGNPVATHKPLIADPLEAGPYTTEQAQRYGVLGTSMAFDAGESGYVVSHDPRYDVALAACQGQLDQLRGEQSAGLVGTTTQLVNKMHGDFVRDLKDRVTTLLTNRLDCVRRNGYPSLTQDVSLVIPDLLASVGVPPGRWDGAKPNEQTVKDGTVAVVSPPPPRVYHPSPEEIAFALTYVSCGQQEDFVTAWDAAQQQPRERVLAENQTDINMLGASLQKTLRVFAAASASGQGGR